MNLLYEMSGVSSYKAQKNIDEVHRKKLFELQRNYNRVIRTFFAICRFSANLATILPKILQQK